MPRELTERMAFVEAQWHDLDRRMENQEDAADANKKEIIAAVNALSGKLDKVVEEKISQLWDDKNKREGAIGSLLALSSAFGGLIVAGFEWLMRK